MCWSIVRHSPAGDSGELPAERDDLPAFAVALALERSGATVTTEIGEFVV